MITNKDKEFIGNPEYNLALEKFLLPELYDDQNEQPICNIFDTRLRNGVVQKAYPFSNENLMEVFEYVGKRENVFVVGSSGDQALQAVLNGAKNIMVADVNLFAKPWIDYKIACIKNLDFDTFSKCYGVSNNDYDEDEDEEIVKFRDDIKSRLSSVFGYEVFKKVFRDLEGESASFWSELFINGVDTDEIFENMLNLDILPSDARCAFYKDEKQYRKLQELLSQKDINIDIKIAEFQDFPAITRDKKFDAILLSNVCKYIRKGIFVDVVNMLHSRLNDGGILQMHYDFGTNVKAHKEILKYAFLGKKIDGKILGDNEDYVYFSKKPKENDIDKEQSL